MHVDCLDPESVSIETPPDVGFASDPRYDVGIWFFNSTGWLELPWFILPGPGSEEVVYVLYVVQIDTYQFSFTMDDTEIL